MQSHNPTDNDLLLIGKTGNGKSATGNTILRRKMFKSRTSGTSVTQDVQYEVSEFNGRVIKVVDGPRVGDTRLNNEKAVDLDMKTMQYAIACNPRGYHAFLLVVRFGRRFTAEDQDTITFLKLFFGDSFMRDFCILVVTHGDHFEKESEETGVTFSEWCKEQRGIFQKLLRECNHRVVLFDNKTNDYNKRNEQVLNLIQVVDNLQSHGHRYSDVYFGKAKGARERIIVEAKKPMIVQEIRAETSLITQKLQEIKEKHDPEDRLQPSEILLTRVEKLYQSIFLQDKGTGALHDLAETVKSIQKIIEQETGFCFRRLDEKERIRKLYEENIRRLQEEMRRQRDDYEKRLQQERLQEEERRRIEREQEKERREAEELRRKEREEMERKLQEQLLEEKRKQQQKMAELERKYLEAKAENETEECIRKEIEEKAKHLQDLLLEIQEIQRIHDPKDRIRALEMLLTRVEKLFQRISLQDKGTGALHDLAETVKSVQNTVEQEIGFCFRILEEKEGIRKLYEENIWRLQEEMRRQREDYEKRLQQERLQEEERRRIEREQEKKCREAEELMKREREEMEGKLQDQLLEEKGKQQQKMAELERKYLEAKAENETEECNRMEREEKVKHLQDLLLEIQEIQRIHDPKDQSRALEILLAKVERLFQSISLQDKGTSALFDLAETVKSMQKTIEQEIGICNRILDEKEGIRKLYEENIRRLQEEMRRQRDDNEKRLQQERLQEEERRQIEREQEKKRREAEERRRKESEEREKHLKDLLLEKGQTIAELERMYQEVTARNDKGFFDRIVDVVTYPFRKPVVLFVLFFSCLTYIVVPRPY